MPRSTLIAVFLALAACTPQGAGGPKTPLEAAAARSARHSHDTPSNLEGSLLIPPRMVDFAVYLPSAVSPALAKGALDSTKRRFPGVDVRGTPPENIAPPQACVFAPPLDSFQPPTEEQLGVFGRGLSPAQTKAAAASKGVLVMTWFLDDDPHRARLREAQKLAGEVADQNGGFIWDEVTRELYTRDEWKKDRIDGWQGDVPDVRRHITIHYYATGDGRHRAITLGMGKFGLPDLVVQDAPKEQGGPIGVLIDATAQALLEGASLAAGGELALDFTAIHHAGARKAYLDLTKADAKRRGKVVLAPADSEEGDPDNRIVELRFPGYPGNEDPERQSAALESFFGAPAADHVVGAAAGDPELAAVTRRVQAKLPSLATAFRNGLPRGESLSVKAPFATDDGSVEWMWVGVAEFTRDTVRGNLESTPESVKSLHDGSRVEVKQKDIADYVWFKADGSRKEGGESADILEARERAKK
jgi:uncharacterized protein YegJ (DUF2314 family)